MAAEPGEFPTGMLNEGAFRALVEAAPDMVVVFDRDGRVRYVNPALTAILGHRPDELIG